jgi:hypothetical protein
MVRLYVEDIRFGFPELLDRLVRGSEAQSFELLGYHSIADAFAPKR